MIPESYGKARCYGALSSLTKGNTFHNRPDVWAITQRSFFQRGAASEESGLLKFILGRKLKSFSSIWKKREAKSTHFTIAKKLSAQMPSVTPRDKIITELERLNSALAANPS